VYAATGAMLVGLMQVRLLMSFCVG
jgi:hypothetical protein